jgi:hypothetical protein
MKKLMLGLALTMFIGTYTVSANYDNPPQDKAKTEAKADKKECSKSTADKKSCCQKDKATASSNAKCCKDGAKTTASTNTK